MKTRKYFLVALLLTLALGQNVGIGTNAPTQRLHVAGNLRLDGAFMPANQPGATGNILLSQGAGTPPIWLANGAVGTILRRNDPYWQARPEEHLVEIPKEPDNIGKYLHPELYGAPRSQRAAYRRGHTLEEIRAYKEAHTQKPNSRNLKTYEGGNRFRR